MNDGVVTVRLHPYVFAGDFLSVAEARRKIAARSCGNPSRAISKIGTRLSLCQLEVIACAAMHMDEVTVCVGDHKGRTEMIEGEPLQQDRALRVASV